MEDKIFREKGDFEDLRPAMDGKRLFLIYYRKMMMLQNGADDILQKGIK